MRMMGSIPIDRMKILICMDSFKGSVDTWEAGQAAARGLQSVLPDAELVLVPVADAERHI